MKNLAVETSSSTNNEGLEFDLPAVNSWDEFTQLREIIVGHASHARVPSMLDPSAWMACYPKLTRKELEALVREGEFPKHVIDESNEDLATLVETLRDLGTTVRQPAPIDHNVGFSSPDWSSSGYLSYCPRDITLVMGSTIIETASPMRSRYFELYGMRDIFQDYMLRGASWIAAPKPQLKDELYSFDEEGRPLLGEMEPVFDAANILRIGGDILYQVSRSGNEMGLKWLESTLRLIGDIKVHPLRGVYGYTHIDTTITLLRPGLALLNPARIKPDEVPEPLCGWDIVWAPEPTSHPMAVKVGLGSSWICINMLMVNPELAIADAAQPALLRTLEKHGITVIPLQLRHAAALGGGFHCVTLDTVREGGMERYLG